MLFLWISFAFSFVILVFFRIVNLNNEFFIFLLIILHFLLVVFYLSKKFQKRIFLIFLTGYILRLTLMLWDLYGRDYYILPNSGADSEMFYYWADQISKNISIINSNIRGGIFSKLYGIIFYMIGGSYRIYGQYINVLCGLSIPILLYSIFVSLKISLKIQYFILLYSSVFFNSLIMSSVFLREIQPTLLLTISLYFFIHWYKKFNYSDIFLSIFFIILASIFHSGLIFVFFGYFYFYLFYKHKLNRFQLSLKTFTVFIIGISIVLLVYNYFSPLVLSKFERVNEITDIYYSANRSAGGSRYLTGLKINNSLQLILFSPIKALFFLISPLPNYWRNLMDLISFFLDSTLYLFLLFIFMKNFRKFINRKYLINSMMLTFLLVSIIFGLGVSNSGTAIRHRQKIVPMVFILIGLIMDEKKKEKSEQQLDQ